MGRRIRQAWNWLRTPSRGIAAGTLVLIGVAIAGVGWGGFSTVLEHTNTLEFCGSCHEMREYVYAEYVESPHYNNSSGVRAICADCHVPHALGPKLLRKMKATFIEVPSHFMGTIDTREKFEAHRARLAENVWEEMKANDSRQCRGCHVRDAMLLANQKPRARAQHEDALATGETCIDCHKGVAHKLPDLPDEPETDAAEEEDFAL